MIGSCKKWALLSLGLGFMLVLTGCPRGNGEPYGRYPRVKAKSEVPSAKTSLYEIDPTHTCQMVGSGAPIASPYRSKLVVQHGTEARLFGDRCSEGEGTVIPLSDVKLLDGSQYALHKTTLYQTRLYPNVVNGENEKPIAEIVCLSTPESSFQLQLIAEVKGVDQKYRLRAVLPFDRPNPIREYSTDRAWQGGALTYDHPDLGTLAVFRTLNIRNVYSGELHGASELRLPDPVLAMDCNVNTYLAPR